MRFFVVLVGFFAVAHAILFVDNVKEEWQTFKLSHSKNYKSDIEEEVRMKIFMENKHKIDEHNLKYAQGLVTYSLSVNEYADLSDEEFDNIMNGFNLDNSQALTALNEANKDSGATFISPANVKLPTFVDWRNEGAVTPVKDQGTPCRSCWAFAVTGALEGQHFRKTGKLVSLSEQNLIDCSQSYGNYGCKGGYFSTTFKYIKENNGIDTEASYIYKGSDDSCHFDKAKIGASNVGFVRIPQGDETKLMEAVATVGPVAVAIHAPIKKYEQGIFDNPDCNSTESLHAVLVVGYGTQEIGGDYWLVKNSWGDKWGENGYIKMARNKNNQCGIATYASYPQV